MRAPATHATYAAPLRALMFTLKEVGGLDAVLALPGHEDTTPDVVQAVLEEAARFASGVLAPLNRVGDRQGARWQAGQVHTAEGFGPAYAQFCANGWLGLPAATAWGGQGLPTLVSTAVLEMWKSSNLAFSLCQMLTLGAVEAIAHHGSEALKQRFLPPLVAGRWTGTMNLTEPQAGSDLAALRSRAVPEGAHYRVSGQKIFITWGEHDLAENIVHLVLARLHDPANPAPAGVKGLSLFLCPKFLVNEDGSLGARNDLLCTGIEHKLGIHGSPTAAMSFGEQGGAIGYLVGQPHQGLACMFTMMNHARLNVGLEGVGLAELAWQQARAYAMSRLQGRTPLPASPSIAGHPDVRRMLMDMKARVQAMRALAFYAAGQMDRAQRHPDEAERRQAQALVELLTPLVKGWCTEQAQAVASDGLQVHGGMGYVEETGAAQTLRDVRITTIYEGTTGIQANDLIGRKLARDGGQTLELLLRRIDADARRLTDAHEASLVQLGQALGLALAALREASAWLLRHGAAQPERCAAGAVPFLRLAGTVVGGWLSARLAQAAVDQRAAGAAEADADFLRGQVVAAQHFATHELVLAPALRDIVCAGAHSTLALSDAQL